MLYRSNTERVLCPVICIATRSGTPTRTRLRTAVLQRPAKEAARELIVLELYRQGEVSSGRAAELLGMEREEFIQIRYASKRGILESVLIEPAKYCAPNSRNGAS
jgi:hypothetical protein